MMQSESPAAEHLAPAEKSAAEVVTVAVSEPTSAAPQAAIPAAPKKTAPSPTAEAPPEKPAVPVVAATIMTKMPTPVLRRPMPIMVRGLMRVPVRVAPAAR
jgi:hypothetical protein